MPLLAWLETIATILGGVVSLVAILSVAVDVVTHGWVRRAVRWWLGIEQLREDHKKSQTFLGDLGRAFNELRGTVCDEHDIPEHEQPVSVRADRYQQLLDDDNEVRSGDFIVDD